MPPERRTEHGGVDGDDRLQPRLGVVAVHHLLEALGRDDVEHAGHAPRVLPRPARPVAERARVRPGHDRRPPEHRPQPFALTTDRAATFHPCHPRPLRTRSASGSVSTTARARSAASPPPSARPAATSPASGASTYGGRRLDEDIVVNCRDERAHRAGPGGGRGPRRRARCSSCSTAPSPCTTAARSRCWPACRWATATTCRWPTRRAWPGCATPSRPSPTACTTCTIKKNTVAIVTDGTAVLGLGDIGPEAALPVMEGKALLFKEFAGVDGFPICLDVTIGRRDRRDRRAHRPDVRRHQPRGHRRPRVLRGRGAPEGAARHPGVPRRPARHRGRHAGRPRERPQDRRQEDGRPARSSSPASAPPAWPSARS